MIDTQKIRSQFPLLSQHVNGQPIAYLDNAATTQKPQAVLDAISHYYQQTNSNVHRGVHRLSQMATEQYEAARKSVQGFVNAKHAHEIVLTQGTTNSINIIAQAFGNQIIKQGDEILISQQEHHSNIVPWQIIAEEKGAILKSIPINKSGELELGTLAQLITERTKIVALTQVSNSLGIINPIQQVIELAHKKNIPVLIDGAQAVPHIAVDVQKLDCDFYVFSGHKLYAPTGVGVLYGKESWLNQLNPQFGGGGMIKEVTIEKTTYADLPEKWEAGTPNMAGAIGLNAAIDYINEIGIENVEVYENELLTYAMSKFRAIDEIEIYGDTLEKAAVISFNLKNVHPFDVGTILDQLGIAVRTGHHCTQPLMKYLGVLGTVRASFSFYNTKEEVDRLVEGIKKAIQLLM